MLIVWLNGDLASVVVVVGAEVVEIRFTDEY